MSHYVVRLLIVLLSCAAPLLAQTADSPTPLYQQEPHDLILLKSAKEPPQKVLPLKLPLRQMPKSPAPNDKLTVRFVDDPAAEFTIAWRNIREIQFFERRVLAEAEQLVESQQFDEAFAIYEFLRANYPTLDTLDASLNRFLFAQARFDRAAGRYEAALASLFELEQRNDKSPELIDELGGVTQQQVERYLKAEQSLAAVQLVDQLANKIPQHSSVKQLRDELSQRAAARVEQAQQCIAAGDVCSAHDHVLVALRLQRDHVEALRLAEELNRTAPRVVVAVSSRSDRQLDRRGLARLADPGLRRLVRLEQRELSEFVAPGTQGGQYASPWGKIDTLELGRVVQIRLDAGEQRPAAYPWVRALRELADPRSLGPFASWADLSPVFQVPGPHQLDVTLAQPHLLPQALLRLPFESSGVAASDPARASIGTPYVLQHTDAAEQRYQLNRRYVLAQGEQPQWIVERPMPSESAASLALERREVQVIERIAPWEVPTWKGRPDFVVEPYAAPSLHGLVATGRRTLSANRTLRRALAYAIERNLIFQRQLMRGNKLAGCALLNGPFPTTAAPFDLLGYGSNERLKPRPYDPQLASVLRGLAEGELKASAERRGERWQGLGELVLAHPPRDVAQLSCQSIAAHWRAIDIPTRLVELSVDDTGLHDEAYDFVYAEWVVTEPLVDAATLLGSGGIAANNPYVAPVLYELLAASDWNAARSRLQQLHQLVYDDVSFIPLWQLSEHGVYDASLQGVGTRPVSLYQQIEHWRVGARAQRGKP